MADYSHIALEARRKVLKLIYDAQTSHIGSNFSCIDLLTVIFENFDWSRDQFVLSAGWKAASLYYFLWRHGRISEYDLDSYCKKGSKFIGLTEPIIPDIQIAGGSMGLGLPGAVGLALAKKLKGEEGTVYCLMSDGEIQTGLTHEAALIARFHKLNNLVVFVDNNDLQAMGRVDSILRTKVVNLFEAWRWEVVPIDGHNFLEIEFSLGDRLKGPRAVIADTEKGRGVSFMEGDNIWHYKAPNASEYEQALSELHV